MGYLEKMRWTQQSESPSPLKMWTPFPEILDPPLIHGQMEQHQTMNYKNRMTHLQTAVDANGD